MLHLDSPTARHRLSWGLGLTLLFNGLLLAWLLLKPGHHALVAAVDNGAQCIGPLLVLPLCLGGRSRWGRRAPTPPPRGLHGGGAGARRLHRDPPPQHRGSTSSGPMHWAPLSTAATRA